MNWPLWWWIAPAVLVFWTVGAHNRLVRLRAAVLRSFALLDGHLQRWTALATTFSSAPVKDPGDRTSATDEPARPGVSEGEATTDTAEDAAVQDSAQWASLRAAAVQLQASMAASRQRPLDRANTAALSAAREVLRTAWRRVLSEAPGFAGIPQAGSIHLLWDQHDTQVQLACDQFNHAVLRYNAALSQFPAAVLAWILRLTPARTL